MVTCVAVGNVGHIKEVSDKLLVWSLGFPNPLDHEETCWVSLNIINPKEHAYTVAVGDTLEVVGQLQTKVDDSGKETKYYTSVIVGRYQVVRKAEKGSGKGKPSGNGNGRGKQGDDDDDDDSGRGRIRNRGEGGSRGKR